MGGFNMNIQKLVCTDFLLIIMCLFIAVNSVFAIEHEELNIRAGEEFKIHYRDYMNEFAIPNGPVKLIKTGREAGLFGKDYYSFEALMPGEAQIVIYAIESTATGGTTSSVKVSTYVNIDVIYDIHISE
jgi:hypothetical protein